MGANFAEISGCYEVIWSKTVQVLFMSLLTESFPGGCCVKFKFILRYANRCNRQ